MILLKRITIFLLLCFCFFQTTRAQWTKQNSNALAWLHSVYFVNQNKGWIVGSNGTFLVTEDAGKTWTAIKKNSDDNIRDVYFADENHGWILSERDVFGGDGFSPSYISETFDGGKNWEKVKLLGEGKERLIRFLFSKDNFGRAVGEAGTFYEMQDDKKIWKKNTLPVRYLLLAGSFPDELHGLVVGGGGTSLFTQDGGMSWNPSSFTSKSAFKLNSVFFINPKIGWAVGAQGKIYATNNGGKMWREQTSNVKKDLFDVVFINTAEGWTVGDEGTILHTTTAGNIWKEDSSSTKHKLERVFFNGKKVWTVGFGGTIMVYEARKQQK